MINDLQRVVRYYFGVGGFKSEQNQENLRIADIPAEIPAEDFLLSLYQSVR
jgi:hypothetical protein